VDGSPNSKFEIKEINIGDIIKFMRYDLHAYSVPAYGIVVECHNAYQLYLFPAVDVLDFKTRNVRTISAATVEVISHA
jgi:hypothetical protein